MEIVHTGKNIIYDMKCILHRLKIVKVYDAVKVYLQILYIHTYLTHILTYKYAYVFNIIYKK